MPMYRSAIHQAPAETQHTPKCRCPECHLKADLFPRNEKGTILLPHPSWTQPLGITHLKHVEVSRRPSRREPPSPPTGKAKEPATWSQAAPVLQGPGQSSSPSWQNRLVSGTSRMASSSHSSPSMNPPTSTAIPESQQDTPSMFHVNLPPLRPTSSASGSSQAKQSLPRVVDIQPVEPADYPARSHAAQRSSSKRKAPEMQDSREHIPSITYPLPPTAVRTSTGRQASPKRQVRRRTTSNRVTVESRDEVHQLSIDGGAHMELGVPRKKIARHSSTSRSDGASTPAIPSRLGSGASTPVPQAVIYSSPSQTHAHTAVNQEPSLIRWNSRPESFQSEGMITMTRLGQRMGSADRDAIPSDPTSKARTPSTVLEDDDERDSGTDNTSDSTQRGNNGILHTRLRTNPIRFREPLTSASRQDRKVLKGAAAVVQVKWDSDRKRRQGYFAPDSGTEKSPFRHYSKEDCCFED